MLQFNEKTSRLLEIAYQGADISRRRRASFDALNPRPGDTILDIGCGNGLLTAELARAVGETGRVIGVDPSDSMRALAVERTGDFANVEILTGDANALPVEAAIADKAVSLQVFEYLDDMPGALAEAHRTLRPGGLLVIGDMHWDTLAWHSDSPARMAKMIEIWDRHLAERTVPALLPHVARKVGYSVERMTPLVCSDIDLKPDGLANMLLILMEAFALKSGDMDEKDVLDWTREQRTLAREGRFFFSLTHFVMTARKT
ncbi:methyltransferase domain-containing protein [Roseibium sp.]|uniref:methyltransferase domain-containing protein n=1 Tax=Roseibium sp. TaxID=1936156 RepID=UPI003D0A601E